MKSKRGQIGMSDVPNMVIAIVLAVIMGGIGLLVMAAFKDSSSDVLPVNDSSLNTTLDQGITSIGNVFDLFPTVGTIVAVVVIIGLLLAGFAGFLYMKGNNGGGSL